VAHGGFKVFSVNAKLQNVGIYTQEGTTLNIFGNTLRQMSTFSYAMNDELFHQN